MRMLVARLEVASLPLTLPSLKKFVKTIDALEVVGEGKEGKITYKVWQAEDKSQARIVKFKGFSKVWNRPEVRRVTQALHKVADELLGDDSIKVKSIQKVSTKKITGYACTFVFDKAVFVTVLEIKS